MLSRYHTKRLVRGGILLAASALFTLIAVLAGANHFEDRNWTYAAILAVISAAAITAHFGTKWVMQRLPDTGSGE